MTKALGTILTELAAADPDRPAVTCADTTVTRAELESQANRLARAYEALGVTEGSMVTIALPNSVEWFAATFAVWKLGAVPQPVSPSLPARERDAIVELADSSLVVGAAIDGRTYVNVGFAPDPGVVRLTDRAVENPAGMEGADVGGQHRSAEADRLRRAGAH